MHRSLSHALLRQETESRLLQQSTPRSTTSLPQSPHQGRSDAPAWREFLKTRHEDHMPGARGTPRARAHGVRHVVARPSPLAGTSARSGQVSTPAEAAHAPTHGERKDGGGGTLAAQPSPSPSGATRNCADGLPSQGSEVMLTAVFERLPVPTGVSAASQRGPGVRAASAAMPHSQHRLATCHSSPSACTPVSADPSIAAAAHAALALDGGVAARDALDAAAGAESSAPTSVPYDEAKMALLEQGHRVNSLTFNQWVRHS